MKLKLLFVALCATLLCAGQDYNVDKIPENLKKNAYAVIRNSSKVYTVNAVNDMEVREEKVITILNESGEPFSVIGIPYNPTTRVSDIKVTVYGASGKEGKTFSKKDFSDVTNNPSNSLYVDDRVLFLRPISTGYPFTIKYSYTTNTSNTVNLSDFRPFNSYNISSEKNSMLINNKAGIKLRSKIVDTEFGKVLQSGTNSQMYSYENIPAISEESLSPSIETLIPHVDFALEKFSLAGNEGDLSSWDGFGKWYYNGLLQPVSTVTPEIRDEINKLNLSGTTAEKVKKIYQFMQSKTHYISVQMGIGGWKPMFADDVRKKGYGDCKALTNYMRTLLDAAGIKSYYCVIYNDESVKTFDENFPALDGNHAILMVPTETENIWLENTSQSIAFNHLSYTSHDRNVLAVDGSGLKLIKTPVYKPEQSKEEMNANVKINEDNSINADGKFVFTGGQYDLNMALFHYNAEDLKSALKSRHDMLKIGDIAIENLKNNRDEAEVSYDLKLKANDFSKKLGNDIFFRVMPFYRPTAYTANEDRKLPFETAFPFEDDYKVTFEIPAGYKFSELPKADDFSSEFGSYTINYQIKENKLEVHRILKINKGIYPKEKYGSYTDFRKKTASNDSTKILITKI